MCKITDLKTSIEELNAEINPFNKGVKAAPVLNKAVEILEKQQCQINVMQSHMQTMQRKITAMSEGVA